VCVSYFNNGSGAEIIEENNHYPFGLKHSGYNGLSGNPSYQYKYNGKELQQESGMYDYGARFYMPDFLLFIINIFHFFMTNLLNHIFKIFNFFSISYSLSKLQ
jgi:hypothetical protein